MLSIIQSFEMFPRHNGVAAISEHFTLNLRISVLLTNKYLFAPLYCKLIENLFLVTVKLSEYISSVLSVCSNPCAGLLPKIKIYFFLLTIFIDELISTSNIMTFLPNPVPENENVSFLSNPISYPEYLYLSISAFLVKVTAPNKQFSNVG